MAIDFTRRGVLGGLPALGLAGAASAQTPLQLQGAHPDDGTAANLDTWLDLYGRPKAKVMLSGLGPFEFMVDTGSTVTVIAERHLAALRAPVVGRTAVAGTTGMADTPVAQLDLVEAGALRKEAMRVAVLPDNGVASMDGILGADAFAGKRLVFNIPGRTVKVENSLHPIRVAPQSNMRIRNGMLAEVDGRIGNVTAKFMLDTGAQNCIANLELSRALFKSNPRLMRLDNVSVYGVTGHVLTGQYIMLPKVELRAFSVTDAGAVALDAPIFDFWGLKDEPAMIVGMNMLSRLRSFTLDYGAKSFDAQLFVELIGRGFEGLG